MNILITGEPRSGKSALLIRCIEDVSEKQGFISREIQENNVRVGFECVSSNDERVVLASVESSSSIRVAKYGVNLEEFEGFLKQLPRVEAGNLIYLDEIGQMQLFSEYFTRVASDYLNAENLFIGTITSVFTNDFIQAVLSRDEVIILRVNHENRDLITDALSGISANIESFNRLPKNVKENIVAMAKGYAGNGQYVLLKKLLKNAIKYIDEGRVKYINEKTYKLVGNTNSHTIQLKNRIWECDCDLFNGRGVFVGLRDDCSHIQSILLMKH